MVTVKKTRKSKVLERTYDWGVTYTTFNRITALIVRKIFVIKRCIYNIKMNTERQRTQKKKTEVMINDLTITVAVW